MVESFVFKYSFISIKYLIKFVKIMDIFIFL